MLLSHVRLSQAGIISKRLDESSWFLAWMLPFTYSTLCYKEIWVFPKMRTVPSVTLSQTPDLENFATASRSRCRQHSSRGVPVCKFYVLFEMRAKRKTCTHLMTFSWIKKGKGNPYSITERRVPELIPVLGSQPAGDVSHKPGGRLPLLSARPAVTPATLKRVATIAVW